MSPRRCRRSAHLPAAGLAPRCAALGTLVALVVLPGCRLRNPGETGFRDSFNDSFRRDSGRETGLFGVGDDFFPRGSGWTGTYNAPDGGEEHRATGDATRWNDVDCYALTAWNSSDEDASYDESTSYYSDDVTGVSLVGIEHADSADVTSVDTLVYDPPMLFVPADPGAVPSFSTVGSARLLVTASDGTVTQDTTIDWSVTGAAVAETIGTPAGTFDGYRITYTPGGSLGYVAGIGMVDMGSGRLLTSFEQGR